MRVKSPGKPVSGLHPGLLFCLFLLKTSIDRCAFFTLVGENTCLSVCRPGWTTDVFILPFQLHASLLFFPAREKRNRWYKEQCALSANFPLGEVRVRYPKSVLSIYSPFTATLSFRDFLWETLNICTQRKQFRPTIVADFLLEPMIYHTRYLAHDWDCTRKCLACWAIHGML